MITIIVPVYNTEKYLNRCIDSILSQTYRDFELLLIDDGSNDSCPKICDEYAAKDSRIRVFHKKNGGVSSARNLGLEHAKGDWITFCDSDDYVTEKLLEDYVAKLHYNADLYVQGYIDLNGANLHKYFKEEFIKLDDGLIETEEIRKRALYSYLFNKMFRREIIQIHNIRFDTSITMVEDTIFVFKYMNFISSVCHIATANYYYEINENSASNKIHSVDSWGAWFNASYSLFQPYLSINSEFANRELRHLWNSMIDAINNRYFIGTPRRERVKMIKYLKTIDTKPSGIYNLSTKGIISVSISFMPIVITDLLLYLFSKFKLHNRSQRLAKKHKQYQIADYSSYKTK